MQDTIVSIRIVKLIHDLLFISIIIESVLFVFFVVRGMGVNFKKFNFDSDISKFEINESDQEEFEVEINVDLDESKRKRKRKLRYLKYAYVENKFLVNTVIIGVVIIFATILVLSLLHGGVNKENVIYSVDTFNIEVENTNILNTDYKGNKIIDDYLLVVNTKISSDLEGVSLYLNDFSLKIGDAIFKPVIKYSNLLSDLGNSYNENTLSSEYTNYLFVFEIPEKYKTSEMLFRYNGNGENIDIKLNPKNLETDKIYTTAKIGENISFEKIIGNIEFKINQYEIKDKFLLNYNFCIEKDDCIESKEYLVPTINQNFDKYILRLDINYTNNSDLDINNFYDFFEKFGLIQYKIEDKWFTQSSNFENIESSKVTTKDNVYIGVDSNISKATEIKLVFKIRDSKYEYSLK